MKKFQFFDGLRKALKGNKLADVALGCYVDLYRAAALTSPNLETSLRLLVSDIDADLKSRLLDPTRPFVNSEGLPDLELMTDAHVALFRLDPPSSSRTMMAAFNNSGTLEVPKLGALYALLFLAQDVRLVSWSELWTIRLHALSQTSIPTASISSLAHPVRSLFSVRRSIFSA